MSRCFLCRYVLVQLALQVVEGVTANGRVELRVRALPLPASVASTLSDNADLLRSAVDAAERQRAGGSGGARNGMRIGGSQDSGGTADVNGAAAGPEQDDHSSRPPVTDAAVSVEGHTTDAMAALQKRCVPLQLVLLSTK